MFTTLAQKREIPIDVSLIQHIWIQMQVVLTDGTPIFLPLKICISGLNRRIVIVAE